jgi:hypothetical protein
MKSWSPYIGIAIAVITALLGIGVKWGEMSARLTALEQQQEYLHGRFEVPR